MDMTESNAIEYDEQPVDTAARLTARKYTGRTRFIATVPSVGLFLCAVVLAIGTLIQTGVVTWEFMQGELTIMDIATEYVEFADLFLLAVVLYIMSLGLLTLFVTDKIPLPKWLEFHDFDDLKERLVSVISVMLGVYFLGYVLKGGHGIEVLWLGLGCAVVIVALAFFVKNVFKAGH